MKTKLVFVGAGGFGREIAWQLSQVNDFIVMYDILGFIDDSCRAGEMINGLPIIGNDNFLINYPSKIAAVICIGNPQKRKLLVEKLKVNPLISFPTIIASDSKYSNSVSFGNGCVICLSTVFTVNIRIGDFVIANLDCTIGHDVIIEDFVTLYPSVNISGNVAIGTCAEIGTGANIIQGVRIGKHSIIGAGSVVIKDIPENCTAVGVPAVPIKKL